MIDLLLVSFSALWLGTLTSVSPCPLATNLAAVAFLTKDVARPIVIVRVSLAYTVGRAMTYMGLGIALVATLVSAPLLSASLQIYGNRILGPVLIVVGMVLLDLLPMPSFAFASLSGNMASWRDRYKGMPGAFGLGCLFSLSFCPVSAALFFGSLIPLSVSTKSLVWLPFVFGIGTAAPVAVLAALLATGTRHMSKIFQGVTQVAQWTRKITGVLFVLIGIYYCIVYLWGWSR